MFKIMALPKRVRLSTISFLRKIKKDVVAILNAPTTKDQQPTTNKSSTS